MFLKGIKRKSAQKCISRLLKVDRQLEQSKLKTIGVLVDARGFYPFPFFNELAEVFNIPNEAIKILCYHPNKKVVKEFTEAVFTDNELGFKGKINNIEVENFINHEFDALINFYNEDELLLNLIAVQSKAKFKIGFTGINENINDFSIATDVTNITTFTFEAKKYLSILNKI